MNRREMLLNGISCLPAIGTIGNSIASELSSSDEIIQYCLKKNDIDLSELNLNSQIRLKNLVQQQIEFGKKYNVANLKEFVYDLYRRFQVIIFVKYEENIPKSQWKKEVAIASYDFQVDCGNLMPTTDLWNF